MPYPLTMQNAPLLRAVLGTMALLCVFCLALPHSGFAAGKADAPVASPIIWQAGPYTVIAIQDRPGEMDAGLFSGPATPEQRKQFFPNGKAPSSISTFLIRTPNKNVLVDTGFGDARPGTSALLTALDSLGLAPENIDLILMTHMHMDHAGGLLLEKARAFPKAKVAIAKPELDYWLDLASKDRSQPNAALVRSVVDAYGTDILPPFAFEEYVMPGVKAVDASGHTPGHTAFLLKAEGKSLLIIGDLVHAADFQFALPEECASYDIDAAKAVAARKRILSLSADENIPVAGMHIPFPSYGKTLKDGNGFKLIRD